MEGGRHKQIRRKCSSGGGSVFGVFSVTHSTQLDALREFLEGVTTTPGGEEDGLHNSVGTDLVVTVDTWFSDNMSRNMGASTPSYYPSEADFVVKTPQKPASSRKHRHHSDQIQYISLIGLMQLVTGCLMVVFGVLSMLHEASLSSVGAGLWSGAMAMGNGVVGLMASLNGCLSPDRTLSPLSVTIYLALCLVSVGVSNLAIVLTAIGLLKDSQKPYYIMPKDKAQYKTLTADQLQTNWAPVLANLGLLLATSVQCLTTMLAAFRFYRLVRLILAGEQQTSWPTNSRHRSPSCCSSSVGSKQKLVQKWLVQQTPSLDRSHHQTNYSGQAYENKLGVYDETETLPKWKSRTTPKSKITRLQEKRERRPSDDVDIHRAYTGMDREIVEEFISVTMDPKHYS
ncbi:CD20-like family [Cinara cedri]|uniref:CD20-like family n=1 Tax=Cinara cedri TaxID=506608 RepID=A0A5E4MVR0_9HEMI|nr:CD20-like family [Cinara cedri]